MENEDTIVDVVRSAKIDNVDDARAAMARVAEAALDTQRQVDAGQKTIAQQDVEIKRQADDLRALEGVIAELRHAKTKQVDEREDVLRMFVDPRGGLSLTQRLGADLPRTRSGKGGHLVLGGGLLTTKPVNEQHSALIKACEDLYLGVTMVFGKSAFIQRDRYNESVIRQSGVLWDNVQRAWQNMPEFIRKAWDGGTGTGGEFIPVPTLASPFWQVQSYDPDGWMQVIPTIELPSLSAKIPAGTALPRPYILKGNTGDNPAALAKGSVGTGEIDPGLVAMYALSFVYKEAEIGAVVPALPFVRDSLAMSLSVGSRLAQVNGDTDGGNDDLTTWDPRGFFGALDAGSIDYLRGFDGLRAIAIADSNTENRATFNMSTLLDDMTSITGPLGATSDQIVGVGPESYLRNFVGLTGIISTSDYGSRTPIADGEVGMIAGRRIVQSDAFTHDLNASGVYDNVTTTKGCAVIFNRMNFRRPTLAGQSMELSQQEDITVDGTYVRGKFHTGLTDMTKSADKPVRYLYNLD